VLVKRRALRGISASPPTRGAFGVVDGGGACERASRAADSHGADARGGGPEEAGADDNQRIMTSDSFLPEKPVIMKRIVCAGLGWRIGSNQAHCSRALRIQLIELNRGGAYGV